MPSRSENATAYLGLGSNLGDRRALLHSAVGALDAATGIRVDFDEGVASLYETSPVGGPPDQNHYLNSAVRVATSLTPNELLDTLQEIETALGRVRDERWGPRAIDIDILLFGDIVIDDDGLVIPHPRMHERRFVLEPLSEIAPDLIHPAFERTMAQLAHHCAKGTGPETVVPLERPGATAWAQDPSLRP